jgi:hypothetical protein
MPAASSAQLEERERVREAFSDADVNHDGQVSREEFSTLLRTLNPSGWTEKKLNTLFKIIDVDGSGAVDIDEFLDWTFPDLPPCSAEAAKSSPPTISAPSTGGDNPGGVTSPASPREEAAGCVSSSSSSSSSDDDAAGGAQKSRSLSSSPTLNKTAKAKKKARKALRHQQPAKPLYSVEAIYGLLNEDSSAFDLQVLVDRFAEARNEGLTARLSELSGDLFDPETQSYGDDSAVCQNSKVHREDVSALEVAHLHAMLEENPSATAKDAIKCCDAVKDVCRTMETTNIAEVGLSSEENVGYGQFARLIELLSATMLLQEQQILVHLAWVEIGKFDLTERMGLLVMQRIFLQNGDNALQTKLHSNDFMRMCHVFKLVDNSFKKGIPHAQTSLFFANTLKNLPQLLSERDQKKSKRNNRTNKNSKNAKAKNHHTHSSLKGRVHLSVLFEELWKIWPDKSEMKSPLLLVLHLLNKYEIGDMQK